MSIDPHNLGDPVYKYDQIYTDDDLTQWVNTFKRLELMFYSMGASIEANMACQIHSVIEEMMRWKAEGKPDLQNWSPTKGK